MSFPWATVGPWSTTPTPLASVLPKTRGGPGDVPGTTADIIRYANVCFLGTGEIPCRAAADVDGDGQVCGAVTDIVFLANQDDEDYDGSLVLKDYVEAVSNGEIAVEIYDSAQLYRDKEVPAAVGSGAIEMGVASLTRYVGDIPAVDIFYQPFLFDSEAKVRAAADTGVMSP